MRKPQAMAPAPGRAQSKTPPATRPMVNPD